MEIEGTVATGSKWRELLCFVKLAVISSVTDASVSEPLNNGCFRIAGRQGVSLGEQLS